MRHHEKRNRRQLCVPRPVTSHFSALLSERPVKRVAIVDTCNLMHACAGMAWDHPVKGSARKQKADAIGAMIVVTQLLKEAFDVHLLVPSEYLSESKTRHVFILEVLKDLGLLIPIDNGCHDDIVLLEMAMNVNGFVVSNDRFRDHSANRNVLGLHSTISNHRCGFIVRRLKYEGHSAANYAANKKNRYRLGMQIFLQPSSFRTMFVYPTDSTYQTAFQMRTLRSQKLAIKVLEEMDICADYVQRVACLFQGIRPPSLSYCNSDGQMSFGEFRACYYESKKEANMKLNFA